MRLIEIPIGADGIKSIIRLLVGDEEAFRTARPSGSSAFSFTIRRGIRDKNQLGLQVMDLLKPGVIEVHLRTYRSS